MSILNGFALPKWSEISPIVSQSVQAVTYNHRMLEVLRLLAMLFIGTYRMVLMYSYRTPAVPHFLMEVIPWRLPYWPLGSVTLGLWVGLQLVMFLLISVSFTMLYTSIKRKDDPFTKVSWLSVFWGSAITSFFFCFLNIKEFIA